MASYNPFERRQQIYNCIMNDNKIINSQNNEETKNLLIERIQEEFKLVGPPVAPKPQKSSSSSSSSSKIPPPPPPPTSSLPTVIPQTSTGSIFAAIQNTNQRPPLNPTNTNDSSGPRIYNMGGPMAPMLTKSQGDGSLQSYNTVMENIRQQLGIN
jgi:hypothetical protein